MNELEAHYASNPGRHIMQIVSLLDEAMIRDRLFLIFVRLEWRRTTVIAGKNQRFCDVCCVD